MGVGARDADASGLQRLAQRIEHRALEFGQFVQEQYAEVGKADLSRPHPQPAADQRRHRCAMVRGPERPPPADPAAIQLAGNRHHRNFQRFGRLQRRQDAGQAGGEQRFAGSGRAAHQQIMPTRGGDLQRTLGDLLPFHLH